MNRDFALKLIKKTKADYNKISSEFNISRSYPWEEFKSLGEFIDTKSKILDLGCGNGRLLEFLITNYSFPTTNYSGLDISEGLLEHAKKKYPKGKFLIGDFLKLPFEDNSFDTIISIAAFHHIPSEELRLEALAEIKRTLKKGGTFALTVWNLWEQEKYKPFIISNRKQQTRLDQFEQVANSNFDIGDSLIPWNSGGKERKLTAERYYHAFTEEELKNLAEKSDFEILKLEKTKFNFLFVLKK